MVIHLPNFTPPLTTFSELTISSPGASASVGIPAPNEAMNLPWAIRRMPSYVDTQETGWFVSPLRRAYDFVNGSRHAAGANPGTGVKSSE